MIPSRNRASLCFCALARDPLLRATVDVVRSAPLGATVTTDMLAGAVGICILIETT